MAEARICSAWSASWFVISWFVKRRTWRDRARHFDMRQRYGSTRWPRRLFRRARSGKPRRGVREAGLVITADLCPTASGLWTRRYLVARFRLSERLGQSLISSLERDCPNRALAQRRGQIDCLVASSSSPLPLIL